MPQFTTRKRAPGTPKVKADSQNAAARSRGEPYPSLVCVLSASYSMSTPQIRHCQPCRARSPLLRRWARSRSERLVYPSWFRTTIRISRSWRTPSRGCRSLAPPGSEQLRSMLCSGKAVELQPPIEWTRGLLTYYFSEFSSICGRYIAPSVLASCNGCLWCFLCVE